ncbi:MAG TPA: mechanosensitive ion channel family protein [Thermoanaerobaculia bacterium]|nr:mechanosensitive ion channel family protein [Thermoanaerobaculia bacterium]
MLRIPLFLAIALISAPAPQQRQPMDAAHVLAFLNRTIAWDERLDAQGALADQPTDVLYVNDNRQIGKQVVDLTFEAAKAEAQLLAASTPAPAAPQNVNAQRLQRMAQRASSAAEQLRREEAHLADLQHSLKAGDPAIAEAQSRVAMAQARNDAVSGMVAIMNSSAATAASNDLSSQIAALEQNFSASAAVRNAPLPVAARKPPPSSVIGLIGDVITLDRKATALETAAHGADLLQRDARDFTAPLAALLGSTRQRADVLMNAPDTTDAAELQRRKLALDALAQQFRQVSAAMMPLVKRRVLLEAYKTNAGRWHSSVTEQHREELQRLLFRAIVLGVMLLFVVAIAVVWRRMTFRYVHDVKRRHHFLLIRRIVILILVAVILIATFASDVSSLTTFVGLLTAGIAIALQDVILSVAGYFVIIGKYGIRAGDRVRIASVNGDVLDVGLVWIYLIELETRGSDQLPTGRIVEFPNSVVFDHSAGIFKQLPGTRFLWHEVSLVVPRDSDFQSTQSRMLNAVEGVYGEYGDVIERQHRDMERLLNTTTTPPRPHSRLRIAPTGVEIRVRYPVEIANAGDIDDRIAAAVTEATRT